MVEKLEEFMASENLSFQKKSEFLAKETEIGFEGFLDYMGNLITKNLVKIIYSICNVGN